MRVYPFHNLLVPVFIIAGTLNSEISYGQKMVDQILWKNGIGSYNNYIIPPVFATKMGTLMAFCEERGKPFLGRHNISQLPDNTSDSKPYGRMEEMNPDELEEILQKNPVAYVPLGTYEHHGWHLPICFDGIKAHELCMLSAKKTGGAVLPTFFYGTGGGHYDYKFSIIVAENLIKPIIAITLDRLTGQGFKIIVILSGHYPNEQIDMVHNLAQEAQSRFPDVRFIGLPEYEITTPFPGDARGGDHAAKYETSIAMALNPNWVTMDRLTAGRDPSKVTLPETRRDSSPIRDPDNPLYAIGGQDPRITASKKNGEIIVNEVISRLSKMVEQSLTEIKGKSSQRK